MSSQPKWELIVNLGDVNPIDHGGYFVYRDATGLFPPEAEYLEPDDSDGSPKSWTIRRFILDQCTLTDGVLSDNKFHPELPAWFGTRFNPDRPQDGDSLKSVADSIGEDVDEFAKSLCSIDPVLRAYAYRAIGEHFGWDNLDGYPITLTSRREVSRRYKLKSR